jgi:tetratricopeptide (TPR) repeat protein
LLVGQRPHEFCSRLENFKIKLMQRKFTKTADEILEQGFDRHQSGHLAEACGHYMEALRLSPESFDANYLMGLGLIAMEKKENALRFLSRSLSLEPGHALALWHFGGLFQSIGIKDAAFTCFNRARFVDPGIADAHARSGDILKSIQDFAGAAECYALAIEKAPENHTYSYELGTALKAWGKLEGATFSFKRCLIYQPDHVNTWTNLGNTLKDLNQLEQALYCHDRVMRLSPGEKSTLLNQSLIFLLKGDYQKGWGLYESRWDTLLKDERRDFKQPRWTGREPVRGKTLFVYSEQGLGDTFQFCRYLPILAGQGVRVIFEAPPEMRALLSSLRGAITLTTPGRPPPPFDFHVPLLSLPIAFGTKLETIPRTIPYLFPPSDQLNFWRTRLKSFSCPKIGLAWSGGTHFKNDQNRSMSLSALKELLELPVHFHVVQKEIRPADRALCDQYLNLHDHGSMLHDFADTAALISALDLIITVDTAVANLAGALGARVWVLLPFAPDFRWLLNREDSPWYPTARLFRQEVTRSWPDVISKVTSSLRHDFNLDQEG